MAMMMNPEEAALLCSHHLDRPSDLSLAPCPPRPAMTQPSAHVMPTLP